MRLGMVPGVAVMSLVSLWSAACSQSQNAPDGLAALDKAYRAGILTADEYATKKAALANRAAQLAALNKALAAGVLTQDEYAAKKSAIPGSLSTAMPAPAGTAPAAATPAFAESQPIASNDASPNPVSVTTGPAAPPVFAAAQTAPVNRTTSPPLVPTASPSDGHTYKMKMVQAMDQHGFERPWPPPPC